MCVHASVDYDYHWTMHCHWATIYGTLPLDVWTIPIAMVGIGKDWKYGQYLLLWWGLVKIGCMDNTYCYGGD